MFVGDRHAERLHHDEEVFPNHALGFCRAVAKQIRRVIGGNHGDSVERELFSADSAHFAVRIVAEQAVDRRQSERDDDFRLDDFDLGDDVGQAVGHFFRRRRAVADERRELRAPFHDVADIDIAAGETGRADDFIEQLSGRSDEGNALRFFFRAGSFAAEKYGRFRIAVTEYEIFSGV